MPRKIYKKKYAKRRKSKSMTKYSGSGLSANYPLTKSFKFKTRYVDVNVAVNPGALGTPGSYIFSLNSLFDPDTTGVGHQPVGYDQLMVMYDHYTVIGARARVSATNQDTTNAQIICLQLKDNATPVTNSETLLENGMNRWAMLGLEGSGSATKTLSINCSLSKFFGRKVLQGDKYTGSRDTSPSDQAYLHVTAIPITTSSNSGIRCCVEIEYIAILTEPKTLGGS